MASDVDEAKQRKESADEKEKASSPFSLGRNTFGKTLGPSVFVFVLRENT